jgi:tRNA threonylcarbamoyladenosine biosynthesis protein TsaB
MIILYIDTSVREEIKVGVEIDGKMHEKKAKNLKSQETLPLIEKLLKEKKVRLNQINEIKVNTGPGSFTGLRVGVSIANSLGFTLKIPVNGKKVGEPVLPVYTEDNGI